MLARKKHTKKTRSFLIKMKITKRQLRRIIKEGDNLNELFGFGKKKMNPDGTECKGCKGLKWAQNDVEIQGWQDRYAKSGQWFMKRREDPKFAEPRMPDDEHYMRGWKRGEQDADDEVKYAHIQLKEGVTEENAMKISKRRLKRIIRETRSPNDMAPKIMQDQEDRELMDQYSDIDDYFDGGYDEEDREWIVYSELSGRFESSGVSDPSELGKIKAYINVNGQAASQHYGSQMAASMMENRMKITKKQLRRIIKEEKAKLFLEANPDGTISDDEEDLEEELASDVLMELDNLIQQVREEAMRIGGGFRGPGIKARIYSEMRKMIEGAK